MKVLHVNSYYKTNALHGELLRALSKLGVDQAVYLPVSKEDIGRNRVRQLKECFGEIYEIGVFRKIARFVWPLKMYQVWRGALSVIRDVSPDMIHAHTVISNGLVAFFAKKLFKLPYVVTVRNTDIDFFFKRIPFFVSIGRAVLSEASRIIVLSPVYVTQKLPLYIPKCDFPNIYEKIDVIPNGVAEKWFEASVGSAKNCQGEVLFLGRIDKNKNLILVIQALERLRRLGVELKLNVVGDGLELNSMRERAKFINAVFYGRIDDVSVVKQVMSHSDILVLPSKRETFGLAYVEAMSQGLPIIYTKGQGFDGFFPEGEVGFGVNADDPQGVADSIQAIYQCYGKMSMNALGASNQYRWPHVARAVMDVYSQCVRDKASPAE